MFLKSSKFTEKLSVKYGVHIHPTLEVFPVTNILH